MRGLHKRLSEVTVNTEKEVALYGKEIFVGPFTTLDAIAVCRYGQYITDVVVYRFSKYFTRHRKDLYVESPAFVHSLLDVNKMKINFENLAHFLIKTAEIKAPTWSDRLKSGLFSHVDNLHLMNTHIQLLHTPNLPTHIRSTTYVAVKCPDERTLDFGGNFQKEFKRLHQGIRFNALGQYHHGVAHTTHTAVGSAHTIDGNSQGSPQHHGRTSGTYSTETFVLFLWVSRHCSSVDGRNRSDRQKARVYSSGRSTSVYPIHDVKSGSEETRHFCAALR